MKKSNTDLSKSPDEFNNSNDLNLDQFEQVFQQDLPIQLSYDVNEENHCHSICNDDSLGKILGREQVGLVWDVPKHLTRWKKKQLEAGVIGLIAGEGCFCLSITADKRAKNGISIMPSFTVGNTDKATIELVATAFNLDPTKTSCCYGNATTKNGKPYYVFAIRDRAVLLSKIFPWILEKWEPSLNPVKYNEFRQVEAATLYLADHRICTQKEFDHLDDICFNLKWNRLGPNSSQQTKDTILNARAIYQKAFTPYQDYQ